MADNIKIIGDINNIQRINRLKPEDLNLLQSEVKNQTFGFENDYIEYFIYDTSGNLINNNYNYKDFKLPFNSYLTPGAKLPEIEIDPIQDLKNFGYISGEFITQYNFQTKKISSPEAELFISQISEDRTEIRINSTIISSTELLNYGSVLINEIDNSIEQKYFLLNLPDNNQSLIVNIAIDVDNPSILLKLYEPLPQQFQDKISVWVTEEIIEPYIFGLNLDTSIIPELPPQLKGPNFDIDIDIKQNLGTKYENYSSLVSSLTGSSYRQVLNYMNDSSYDLNIDYTLFENFIHFSSAKKRLEIFFNKINQIESYDTDISTLLLSNSILKNEETASIKLKIDNITKNFDGFENYLYFESSSYTWPKTNNIKPYKNKFINKRFYQLTTSSIWNFTHSLNEIPTIIAIYSGSGQLLTTQSSVIGTNTLSLTFNNATSSGYVILSSPNTSAWYTNYTSSALLYDDNNLDHLYNIAPAYVKNDPLNYQPYYDFTDMIGHYFDNIWIYITSINELYNADNNLEKGVSKDIVYDALRSLGVKLYNSKGDDNFEDYVGGLNSGSTLFTDNFSATSSYLNNVPKKDLLAETFKRIYHNIPLLSKTKGTLTGLQELITTFGVTSSIFSPNEFGGSTKKNQLKGYDNDKITIQNNTITGSVLSPFISLQQPFTASSDFTSTDLHFVDLSFSPQTELNSRISASVAVTYPTFSIDEYIGDPRLMASLSYDNLIAQQNYFVSASSAVSGSAKRLDYKGFIELVKYFDNSLFKMLKDFVPARTNALTGITIKSPVLERNKVPVYHPKVTEETTYDANYSGPTITEDKTYHYNKVTGNKFSFYTGEFTGSYVNINDVFENSNPNPYLHPTKLVNIDQFNHTDFNVTLNNVSSSVISNSRQKLEKIYTTSNNYVFSSGSEYTSNAELQESNLSLRGYQNSRYEGTKISSLKFNTFSSASNTYSGDNSYGKTAVIEHNTRKLGLFTQITENIFLPSTKKNNVALRYLVDESGSLTELNKNNKHWHELQNTFKSGNNLTIALFNNQKNGDQKSTDGSKPIFDSGYNYVPMLYFSGSEPRSYFEYAGENVGKIFQAKNRIQSIPGPVGYIYGGVGGNNGYPLSTSGSDSNKKVIYNIFDIIESNDGTLFTAGSSTNNTYPSYSVASNGSYTFSSEFDIYVDLKSSLQSVSFKYEIIKGSLISGHPTGTVLGFTPTKTFSSAYSADSIFRGYDYRNKPGFYYEDSSVLIPDTLSPLTIFDGSSNKLLTLSWSGTTNVFSGTDANGTTNTYYLVSGTWSYDEDGGYRPSFTKLILNRNGSGAGMADEDYILTVDNSIYFTSNQTGTLSFNLTTNEASLLKDDKVYFKLTKESSTTSDYTASFSTAGKLRNNLVANTFGDFVYAEGSASNRLISSSISDADGNNNTIVLNSSLTGLEKYQFIAEQGTGDNKILYNNYGSVNEFFIPSPGDVVVMYWADRSQNVELTIKNVGYKDSKRSITFTTNLPSSLSTQLNASPVSNTLEGGADVFLLLKKKSDETNILLKFNKKDGTTSLGLIIPDNLHPDVLANIDTITKEVKQKLIDFGVTDIGGVY
jgi:hypothetical protein